MPVVQDTRHNGNIVTSELVDSVGIAERTYTFPDATLRETLEVSNESANPLIVSVGTQVNVVIPGFQSQSFAQSFIDFKMKAQTGHASFRVKATYYESDEEDERTLATEVNVLASVGENVEKFKLQIPELDDTPRIKRASDAAGTTGRVIIPPRTYYISSKVTFQGHVDATGATFIVTTNIPIAVELREGNGNTLYRGKTAYLPNVRKQTKTWDGTDVGVQATNIHESTVHFGNVSDFSKGILITAESTGNSYNDYYFHYLENNKVNLELRPSGNGSWVNENNFYGGRFGHYSTAGAAAPGTRHILIGENGDHTPNNNTFFKPSLEGDVPEFHIECFGSYHYFLFARYEAPTPRVAFRNLAHSNLLFNGYSLIDVVITADAGTKWNTVSSPNRNRIHGSNTGSTFVVSNSSGGGSSAISVLDVTANINTNPLTDYVSSFGSSFSKFKKATDLFPRIQIEQQSGNIGFGDGTVAITKKLRNYGTNIGIEGANLQFIGGKWDSEHIQLAGYHLWVDSVGKLRFKNSAPTSDTDGSPINGEAGTTAQRPTTNLYVGRPYYDTDLGKPINVHQVSPTIWHDGVGATV
jgi:hypothetical protein